MTKPVGSSARRPWNAALTELSNLRPRKRNARTHSKRQIRQVADSIKEFGFPNPVIATADGEIVAGHCRYEAAKLLGLEMVPVVRLDGLTPAQVRAYALADNKLALLAGWDPEILATELEELSTLDVDLSITGFEAPEIEAVLNGAGGKREIEADRVPDADSGTSVTQKGDLWRLRDHRLLCGDARNAGDYSRLLCGEYAQMCITDPPFNQKVSGHVGAEVQLSIANSLWLPAKCLPPTSGNSSRKVCVRSL
jgi:hypothetical protein